MTSKSKKTLLISIAAGIIVIVGLGFLIQKTARKEFTIEARDSMEMTARINRSNFESAMNEQLTLVLQMMKMPSIKEFLKNPYDDSLREAAYRDFGTFRDSFKSKSIFWISSVDLEFWSDMEFSYVVNPDNPDDYWYKMTMFETDVYNFNINYNPSLGTTNLWVNAVVRDGNTPIGIVGTGIPLTDMINDMYSGLESSITMYLYNDGMEITGALDANILEKKLSILDEMPHLNDLENKPKDLSFESVSDGEYLLLPIDLVSWHIAMFKPFTIGDFFHYGLTALIAAIIAITIVIVLTVQIVTMVNQLTILNEAVLDLSSGNADLTKRVNLKNRTIFKVFGTLVESENKFIAKLQEIIGKVKDSDSKLNSVGGTMTVSTENTASAIMQIIANIESVHSQITQQSNNVHETAGAVNEIAANIESLERMIQHQAAGVTQASAAVEQMVGNIQSVNNSVEKMSNSFTELESQAQNGQSKQQSVNEKIAQIEDKSKMLQDANQAISNIASQTNLLAMNAAIEAAHAGEAGKGFAVVADEIRKLSETSTVQSKTIGEQLKSIQSSIMEVVSESQESSRAFSIVSDEIEQTNQLVREIKIAMDEQNEGSKQIIDTLHTMNNSTSEVSNAAHEMTEGNKVILQNMESLQDSSNAMKTSMDEMSVGAKKINETGAELSEIAIQMKDSIEEIDGQMKQFNV